MRLIDRLEAAVVIDRQFLRNVRDCQKLIVAHELLDEGLRLHRLMRQRDLYIGAPPPPVNYGKSIVLEYGGMCQRCGKDIPVGHSAIWVHGVGDWHHDCWSREQAEKPPGQAMEIRP